MTKFNDDLTIGHKAEDYILSQLKEEFPSIKRFKGYNKDFDLVTVDGYSFEVKFDRISKDTKRVGFEFECNGKPSGIKSTKANEWIHIYYLYDKWVYSRVAIKSLKAFLRNNKEYLQIAEGGDNNASKMALVSVYDFSETFSFTPINL